MAHTVLYLRPPAPPTRKGAKKPNQVGAWEDIRRVAWKHRHFFYPHLVSLWVAMGAILLGPWHHGWMPTGTALLVSAYAGAGIWWWYQLHAKVALVRRAWNQRYGLVPVSASGLWSLVSTWGSAVPPLGWYGILMLGTAVVATPWYWHRRWTVRIPVRFTGLTQAEILARRREAIQLINQWTAFTSTSNLAGAVLRTIAFDRWSVVIGVNLKPGQVVAEFTPLRLRKLESAATRIWPNLQEGSSRVQSVASFADEDNETVLRGSAVLATVRLMLTDPHERPIAPFDEPATGIDDIAIGVFETGARVIFRMVHTVIAGRMDSGKSGVISALIDRLAPLPNVALIGMDLKPGAPELGKWKSVLFMLAKTPDECRTVFEALDAEAMRRGRLMEERGWRKWVATAAEPQIVVIIDEVQILVQNRMKKYIIHVAGTYRALGITLVVATQHPKDENLPATVTNNCSQKIGLATESDDADRVIFGRQATRTGWTPSTIIPATRQGSFLIRSPIYTKPCLARAVYMSDEDIDIRAERYMPQRTRIEQWQNHQMAGQAPTAAIGTTMVVTANVVDREREEIVDAVLVTAPAEAVLDAVEAGYGTLSKIVEYTGVPRATVIRWLKHLQESGAIVQAGPRQPYRKA